MSGAEPGPESARGSVSARFREGRIAYVVVKTNSQRKGRIGTNPIGQLAGSSKAFRHKILDYSGADVLVWLGLPFVPKSHCGDWGRQDSAHAKSLLFRLG